MPAINPIVASLMDHFIPQPQAIYIICSLAFGSLVCYVARWHRETVGEPSILRELPNLGKRRYGERRIDGTAVVAGGSIAGLLAARVCSNHFTRVVIVEPEAWLSTTAGLAHDPRVGEGVDGMKPNPRTRVMQYNSMHNYHIYTYLALKEMFPDFEDEVRKIDPDAIARPDINVLVGGRRLSVPDSCYQGASSMHLSIGRPTYETLLRKLVRRNCDNVEFATGIVTGFQVAGKQGPDSTRQRVRSVTIRSKDGAETTEPALLLIDCTGPTQAGLKWVSSPSHPLKVAKDIYDPKMFYTTCEFEVQPSMMDKVEVSGGYGNARGILLYIPDPRTDRRTLYIFKREHSTLQIACGGWDISDRPRSIDDLRTFISGFKSSEAEPVPGYVFQILDVLELNKCGESATYTDAKCAPCYFTKYHDVLDKVPTNFIAIGDSVMRLNPARSQGCTKAMIGAATLSGVLNQTMPFFDTESSDVYLPKDFGKKFWKRHSDRIAPLWTESKAGDYGWESTIPVEGETLKDGALLRWYGRNFLSVAFKNEHVATVLYNSSMFIAPGSDAISPGIVIRVLWAGIKEYLGFTN
ncbi:hypothetical protein SISSUDRAFT_1056272 [Sistotremastrum suecicum HHB10207 ss-3]|uniref:FAD/NAD(P)-binding domain-containing protein n=1 Tax=Sistotremastrum suecicum HHB10207 ss-3 TaxID=1314776 RepID=A0A165X2T8_9AGAM|nr:hypothetical protein SISSUDRAFT_1056272 [Sistotremastrum suecicum HHB10207 ss-3]